MNELLTPRERFGLLLIDEVPDRVISYPLVTNHAARVIGISVKEYCTSAKLMAQAQIAAQKKYGHDAISIFSDVGLLAEAMGSKFDYPDDDVPFLNTPVLDSLEKIESLQIPDCKRDGRLPFYLEATERCFDEVGDAVPIIVFIPAPFSTASYLRDQAQFLRDTITQSERVHQILRIATDAAKTLIDGVMDAGGLPMLVDPLASGSVISPRTFQAFALPYLKELIAYLRRFDLDTMLHICGNTSLFPELIEQTEVDLFSCDQVDLRAMVDKLGEKIRLIGNISPSHLLIDSPDQIAEKAKSCIEAGKYSPKGYILASGCEVPVDAPPENVLAMVAMAKEVGKYWR